LKLSNEPIPQWAVELTKQVAILNEKIPTHVDWVERNMKDHEVRLRALEQFRWILMGVAIASGGVGAWIGRLLV
jgi:hypothetical protein